MADATSNLAEIEALLKGIIDGWDFDRPGTDRSLGLDLAGIVGAGIAERSLGEAKSPDGEGWRPNEAKYAARKKEKLGVTNVGVLSGQMLSLQEILGNVDVQPDEVTIRYGSGAAGVEPDGWRADGSGPPGELPTPEQKLEYFEAGGRKVWGLDDAIRAEMTREAADHFGRFVAGEIGG